MNEKIRSETKEFAKLLDVIDRLLGPGGCPWDHEQTLESMREALLEETYELLEAINDCDRPHIQEEIGDLFFLTLFVSRLAERDLEISTSQVLADASGKLIRRHPHVFGEGEVENTQTVVDQWEQIKQAEKKERKSGLDGIPKTLPAVSRSQKVLKKFAKADFSSQLTPETEEEKLAETLLEGVAKARGQEIDAEAALLAWLQKKENEFRLFEENRGN